MTLLDNESRERAPDALIEEAREAQRRRYRRWVGGLTLLAASIAGGFLALGGGGSPPGASDPAPTMVHPSPAASTSNDRVSPVTMAQAGSFQDYQLSSDASGAATVVWSAEDIVDGMAGAALGVREQDARGNWEPSRQLGTVAQYSVPQLTESPSGAAVIVVSYVENAVQAPRHGRTVVEAFARSSPTSRWAGPLVVASQPNADEAVTTVGIDAAGMATVVWADYSSRPSIWAATVNSSNGTVSRKTQLVGPGRGGTDLDLAINPAGDSLLTWRAETPASSGNGESVQATEMAAYRSSGGPWSSPHPLASFTFQNQVGTEFWGPESPSIALTDSGNAAVAWIAGFGNTGVPLRVATYNTATKTWTPTHLLAAKPNGFGIAASGNSSFVSVWSTGPRATLMTATSSNGTTWSLGTRLSQYPYPSDLDDYLANNQAGDLTLTLAGPHSQIFYLTRKPGGTWSDPKSAATGYSPEAAVADHGATTLLWARAHQQASELQARPLQ